MYTISSDILSRFQSGQKQYARLTFSNNSTIENDRIIQGTFSINRYVVTGESIGIGSTVAAELSFVLRNGDAAYTSDDFLDEEVFAEIGVMDSNDTIQYVPFGYYTFDDATESATTINLSALDRMLKFEKTVGTITFPITVNNLLAAACTACSVTLDSSVTGLVNGSYSVTGLPDSVKTWREVLQWICEITGTNAWITRDGKLKLSWFATSSSATLTNANRLNSSVGKDVISITGVTILANNVKYTAGTNTRPLTITDNGLISHDHQAVADAINTARNGYSYSSFTATAMPLPQLDPMDVITFVKESSNISCPVTDITFKLSGMTTLGCKSDQLAHGRSYGLQDATFYAHNIAANAVTADKISVDDLAALRATIAGWKISTDALYKDITINGTTYRVSMNAPASPTLTTPAFSVKKRTSSSNPWEEVADILYSGKVISKDFEATGSVKIQPDYDMQAAGVYAIDLEQNGAELYANPNFLNIEEGGSQTHLDSTVISSTAADDTMLRMENYGADYAEFRATQGTYGQSSYREGSLSPKEVRFSKRDSSASAHMNADEVEVGDSKMESGSFTSENNDYRASMWTTSGGGFFEVYDQNSGKSSMLSLSELTVNDRDILRTHQSLVGGYGTQITANKDLNTNEFLKVGRYYCGQNVTVATLSNCPTGNAFMMDVFAPISSSFDDESSGGSRYRVRVLMHFYGGIYVQYAYASSSSGSTWTYGSWMMITTSTTDEGNSAYWMKAQAYRPSSLDNLTRTYANSRVHMRLDIVSPLVSSSPFDGDGYLLTFFWDSDGLWDTQVFFPNGGGTPSIRKRRNNTSWEVAAKFVLDNEYKTDTSASYAMTANTWVDTASFTVPSTGLYAIEAAQYYSNAYPLGVAIYVQSGPSPWILAREIASNDTDGNIGFSSSTSRRFCSCVSYLGAGTVVKVRCKASGSGNNTVLLRAKKLQW